MRSPLFFIHVTKTAGGTLKQAMQKLKGHRVHFVYSQADRAAIDPEKHDIIYGHYLWGIHSKFDVPPRYAMFVRNPIERVISHYYHLRNVEQKRLGDIARQYNDINDFIANAEPHWEMDNMLVRLVAARTGANPPSFDIMTKQAIKRLANFEFIGSQDHFSYSVRRLEAYLGESLSIDKHINIGTYDRGDATDETLQRLTESHKFDSRFYSRALERVFDPDLPRFSPDTQMTPKER